MLAVLFMIAVLFMHMALVRFHWTVMDLTIRFSKICFQMFCLFLNFQRILFRFLFCATMVSELFLGKMTAIAPLKNEVKSLQLPTMRTTLIFWMEKLLSFVQWTMQIQPKISVILSARKTNNPWFYGTSDSDMLERQGCNWFFATLEST